MPNIDVHSSTQRVVVSSRQRIDVDDRKVKVTNSFQRLAVINAGPPGPPGTKGDAGANSFAEGTQDFPSQTWIMNYILDGKPASFRFWDEDGQEWEPEDIVYVNPSRSIAQWPEPMMGSWIAS